MHILEELIMCRQCNEHSKPFLVLGFHPQIQTDDKKSIALTSASCFTRHSRPPSDALPRCFFYAAEEGATWKADLSRIPSPQCVQAICGGKKTTRKCTARLLYLDESLKRVDIYDYLIT
jgi:hypothetical protein